MENNQKEMKSWEYIIQTKKEHIDFINKIIEAYDGLGNVRTLDNQNGLIKILTNSYLLDDMDKAIETLRQKILKWKFWKEENGLEYYNSKPFLLINFFNNNLTFLLY